MSTALDRAALMSVRAEIAAYDPRSTSDDVVRLDNAARRAGSFGDRPLVVLTAGRYWKPDDPVLAKQADEFHDVWVHQLQASLARLSTRGRQIVVANADHGIADEAPDVVIDAVRSVVDQIRTEVSGKSLFTPITFRRVPSLEGRLARASAAHSSARNA